MRLLARLIYHLMLLLGRTWRIQVVDESSTIDRWSRSRDPHLVSFWHNRLVLVVPWVQRYLRPHGLPLRILVSLSGDGDLGTRVAQHLGVDVVRGSSSRGGASGLRALHRAVREQRASPVIVPDGPRGPCYELKPGVVALVRTAGVPLLPLGFAAERHWRLRSWDRLIIPRPGSRVCCVIGEPIGWTKGAEPPPDEMARQLTAALDRATLEAERRLGVEDVARSTPASS